MYVVIRRGAGFFAPLLLWPLGGLGTPTGVAETSPRDNFGGLLGGEEAPPKQHVGQTRWLRGPYAAPQRPPKDWIEAYRVCRRRDAENRQPFGAETGKSALQRKSTLKPQRRAVGAPRARRGLQTQCGHAVTATLLADCAPLRGKPLQPRAPSNRQNSPPPRRRRAAETQTPHSGRRRNRFFATA